MSASEDQHGDHLSDFTRDRRMIVLAFMAAIVGALSTGIAWVLLRLIALFTNLAFHQRFSVAAAEPSGALGAWVIVVPAIGGLVIGLIARYGSERIRGHGIPEAIEAILFGRSRMDAKVAVLKPLTSAISIGTGGPFGAEGPIIMTGGAFASLFAQLFHLSNHERRTLLVAGAVAGMAAVFGTPLAALLLAVELLLFEWRPRSFVPVAVSVAVAGTLRVGLFGAGPLFAVAPHAALDGIGMLGALALGLACGVGSGLLTMLVYFFEDAFQRLPIHWMWWPALGGLAVGVGGLIEPQALGVGYGNIHALLAGQMVGNGALMLLVVKALIWAIALGSGTSGGVLAPLLMMGAALGTVLTPWLPVPDHTIWATLGMAAMMGGTMRSPLTAIAFALELTHDLGLMPGVLVACIAAHGFTVLVMRRSILTEKVARRGLHVSREYSVDPLTMARVSDVMDRGVQTVPGALPLSELAERMARSDPSVTRRHAVVLTDKHSTPVGIVTRSDVMEAFEVSRQSHWPVIDAASTDLIVAYPDEPLHDAALRMLRHGVGRLPVVSRAKPHTLLGYLGRAEVMSARLKRFDDEHGSDPGWIANATRG